MSLILSKAFIACKSYHSAIKLGVNTLDFNTFAEAVKMATKAYSWN